MSFFPRTRISTSPAGRAQPFTFPSHSLPASAHDYEVRQETDCSTFGRDWIHPSSEETYRRLPLQAQSESENNNTRVELVPFPSLTFPSFFLVQPRSTSSRTSSTHTSTFETTNPTTSPTSNKPTSTSSSRERCWMTLIQDEQADALTPHARLLILIDSIRFVFFNEAEHVRIVHIKESLRRISVVDDHIGRDVSEGVLSILAEGPESLGLYLVWLEEHIGEERVQDGQWSSKAYEAEKVSSRFRSGLALARDADRSSHSRRTRSRATSLPSRPNADFDVHLCFRGTRSPPSSLSSPNPSSAIPTFELASRSRLSRTTTLRSRCSSLSSARNSPKESSPQDTLSRLSSISVRIFTSEFVW